MSTAIGPRAGLPREATTPFVVLALCWLPVGVVALIWVGGHTASLVTGHGWTGPDFGWDSARTLVGPDGVQTAWPRTPPALVWACTGLLAAALTGPVALLGVRWLRQRPAGDDPLPSLAGARDVRMLTAPESEKRAHRLRPTLADKPKTNSRAGTSASPSAPCANTRRSSGAGRSSCARPGRTSCSP